TPNPQVLQTRSDSAGSPQNASAETNVASSTIKHRRSYKPSHKATIIGIAAVMLILIINAVVFEVLLKKQAQKDTLAQKGQVSISSADLNKLGINKSTLGSSGVQLVVAPDAQFKGKVSVDGNTILSGPLTLNSKLTTTNANISDLQAGKT